MAQIPPNLMDVMKELSKYIIKDQPDNIHKYAYEFFTNKIIERDGHLNKNYEGFHEEEVARSEGHIEKYILDTSLVSNELKIKLENVQKKQNNFKTETTKRKSKLTVHKSTHRDYDVTEISKRHVTLENTSVSTNLYNQADTVDCTETKLSDVDEQINLNNDEVDCTDIKLEDNNVHIQDNKDAVDCTDTQLSGVNKTLLDDNAEKDTLVTEHLKHDKDEHSDSLNLIASATPAGTGVLIASGISGIKLTDVSETITDIKTAKERETLDKNHLNSDKEEKNENLNAAVIGTGVLATSETSQNSLTEVNQQIPNSNIVKQNETLEKVHSQSKLDNEEKKKNLNLLGNSADRVGARAGIDSELSEIKINNGDEQIPENNIEEQKGPLEKENLNSKLDREQKNGNMNLINNTAVAMGTGALIASGVSQIKLIDTDEQTLNNNTGKENDTLEKEYLKSKPDNEEKKDYNNLIGNAMTATGKETSIASEVSEIKISEVNEQIPDNKIERENNAIEEEHSTSKLDKEGKPQNTNIIGNSADVVGTGTLIANGVSEISSEIAVVKSRSSNLEENIEMNKNFDNEKVKDGSNYEETIKKDSHNQNSDDYQRSTESKLKEENLNANEENESKKNIKKDEPNFEKISKDSQKLVSEHTISQENNEDTKVKTLNTSFDNSLNQFQDIKTLNAEELISHEPNNTEKIVNDNISTFASQNGVAEIKHGISADENKNNEMQNILEETADKVEILKDTNTRRKCDGNELIVENNLNTDTIDNQLENTKSKQIAENGEKVEDSLEVENETVIENPDFKTISSLNEIEVEGIKIREKEFKKTHDDIVNFLENERKSIFKPIQIISSTSELNEGKNENTINNLEKSSLHTDEKKQKDSQHLKENITYESNDNLNNQVFQGNNIPKIENLKKDLIQSAHDNYEIALEDQNKVASKILSEETKDFQINDNSAKPEKISDADTKSEIESKVYNNQINNKDEMVTENSDEMPENHKIADLQDNTEIMKSITKRNAPANGNKEILKEDLADDSCTKNIKSTEERNKIEKILTDTNGNGGKKDFGVNAAEISKIPEKTEKPEILEKENENITKKENENIGNYTDTAEQNLKQKNEEDEKFDIDDLIEVNKKKVIKKEYSVDSLATAETRPSSVIITNGPTNLPKTENELEIKVHDSEIKKLDSKNYNYDNVVFPDNKIADEFKITEHQIEKNQKKDIKEDKNVDKNDFLLDTVNKEIDNVPHSEPVNKNLDLIPEVYLKNNESESIILVDKKIEETETDSKLIEVVAETKDDSNEQMRRDYINHSIVKKPTENFNNDLERKKNDDDNKEDKTTYSKEYPEEPESASETNAKVIRSNSLNSNHEHEQSTNDENNLNKNDEAMEIITIAIKKQVGKDDVENFNLQHQSLNKSSPSKEFIGDINDIKSNTGLIHETPDQDNESFDSQIRVLPKQSEVVEVEDLIEKKTINVLNSPIQNTTNNLSDNENTPVNLRKLNYDAVFDNNDHNFGNDESFTDEPSEINYDSLINENMSDEKLQANENEPSDNEINELEQSGQPHTKQGIEEKTTQSVKVSQIDRKEEIVNSDNFKSTEKVAGPNINTADHLIENENMEHNNHIQVNEGKKINTDIKGINHFDTNVTKFADHKSDSASRLEENVSNVEIDNSGRHFENDHHSTINNSTVVNEMHNINQTILTTSEVVESVVNITEMTTIMIKEEYETESEHEDVNNLIEKSFQKSTLMEKKSYVVNEYTKDTTYNETNEEKTSQAVNTENLETDGMYTEKISNCFEKCVEEKIISEEITEKFMETTAIESSVQEINPDELTNAKEKSSEVIIETSSNSEIKEMNSSISTKLIKEITKTDDFTKNDENLNLKHQNVKICKTVDTEETIESDNVKEHPSNEYAKAEKVIDTAANLTNKIIHDGQEYNIPEKGNILTEVRKTNPTNGLSKEKTILLQKNSAEGGNSNEIKIVLDDINGQLSNAGSKENKINVYQPSKSLRINENDSRICMQIDSGNDRDKTHNIDNNNFMDLEDNLGQGNDLQILDSGKQSLEDCSINYSDTSFETETTERNILLEGKPVDVDPDNEKTKIAGIIKEDFNELESRSADLTATVSEDKSLRGNENVEIAIIENSQKELKNLKKIELNDGKNLDNHNAENQNKLLLANSSENFQNSLDYNDQHVNDVVKNKEIITNKTNKQRNKRQAVIDDELVHGKKVNHKNIAQNFAETNKNSLNTITQPDEIKGIQFSTDSTVNNNFENVDAVKENISILHIEKENNSEIEINNSPDNGKKKNIGNVRNNDNKDNVESQLVLEPSNKDDNKSVEQYAGDIETPVFPEKLKKSQQPTNFTAQKDDIVKYITGGDSVTGIAEESDMEGRDIINGIVVKYQPQINFQEAYIASSTNVSQGSNMHAELTEDMFPENKANSSQINLIDTENKIISIQPEIKTTEHDDEMRTIKETSSTESKENLSENQNNKLSKESSYPNQELISSQISNVSDSQKITNDNLIKVACELQSTKKNDNVLKGSESLKCEEQYLEFAEKADAVNAVTSKASDLQHEEYVKTEVSIISPIHLELSKLKKTEQNGDNLAFERIENSEASKHREELKSSRDTVNSQISENNINEQSSAVEKFKKEMAEEDVFGLEVPSHLEKNKSENETDFKSGANENLKNIEPSHIVKENTENISVSLQNNEQSITLEPENFEQKELDNSEKNSCDNVDLIKGIRKSEKRVEIPKKYSESNSIEHTLIEEKEIFNDTGKKDSQEPSITPRLNSESEDLSELNKFEGQDDKNIVFEEIIKVLYFPQLTMESTQESLEIKELNKELQIHSGELVDLKVNPNSNEKLSYISEIKNDDLSPKVSDCGDQKLDNSNIQETKEDLETNIEIKNIMEGNISIKQLESLEDRKFNEASNLNEDICDKNPDIGKYYNDSESKIKRQISFEKQLSTNQSIFLEDKNSNDISQSIDKTNQFIEVSITGENNKGLARNIEDQEKLSEKVQSKDFDNLEIHKAVEKEQDLENMVQIQNLAQEKIFSKEDKNCNLDSAGEKIKNLENETEIQKTLEIKVVASKQLDNTTDQRLDFPSLSENSNFEDYLPIKEKFQNALDEKMSSNNILQNLKSNDISDEKLLPEEKDESIEKETGIILEEKILLNQLNHNLNKHFNKESSIPEKTNEHLRNNTETQNQIDENQLVDLEKNNENLIYKIEIQGEQKVLSKTLHGLKDQEDVEVTNSSENIAKENAISADHFKNFENKSEFPLEQELSDSMDQKNKSIKTQNNLEKNISSKQLDVLKKNQKPNDESNASESYGKEEAGNNQNLEKKNELQYVQKQSDLKYQKTKEIEIKEEIQQNICSKKLDDLDNQKGDDKSNSSANVTTKHPIEACNNQNLETHKKLQYLEELPDSQDQTMKENRLNSKEISNDLEKKSKVQIEEKLSSHQIGDLKDQKPGDESNSNVNYDEEDPILTEQNQGIENKDELQYVEESSDLKDRKQERKKRSSKENNENENLDKSKIETVKDQIYNETKTENLEQDNVNLEKQEEGQNVLEKDPLLILLDSEKNKHNQNSMASPSDRTPDAPKIYNTQNEVNTQSLIKDTEENRTDQIKNVSSPIVSKTTAEYRITKSGKQDVTPQQPSNDDSRILGTEKKFESKESAKDILLKERARFETSNSMISPLDKLILTHQDVDVENQKVNEIEDEDEESLNMVRRKLSQSNVNLKTKSLDLNRIIRASSAGAEDEFRVDDDVEIYNLNNLESEDSTELEGNMILSKEIRSAIEAIENSSTESTITDSTIINAVTKIQAVGRGYLTRLKYKRGDFRKSLPIKTDFKSFSSYSAESSIGRRFSIISEFKKSNSWPEVKLAAKTQYLQKLDSEIMQKALFSQDTTEEKDDDDNKSTEDDTIKQSSALASRRLTLQRGDAIQINSAETVTEAQAVVEKNPAALEQNVNKKWFMIRQHTMPVQIDAEVLRLMPKHLRKRIRSADLNKKNKPKRIMF